MKLGIKSKVLLMFIFLITLPVIALGVSSYFNSVDVLKNNLKLSTAQLIDQTEESINNYMNGFQDGVVLMSTKTSVQTVTVDTDGVSGASTAGEEVVEGSADVEMTQSSVSLSSLDWMMKDFKGYIESNENVMAIYLGTKNSDMLVYPDIDLPEDFDPVGRPWYQDALAKEEFIWTEPYTDASSGELIISAAIPVYNQENGDEFVGVLGIDLSLEALSNKINSINIGKNGYPVLLDSQLNIMTHKNNELIGEPIDGEEITGALQSMAKGEIEYEREENGTLEQKIDVFKKIDKLGWTVMVTMDVKEISEDLMTMIYNTLLIGGISLILAIGISYIFSNSLTKDIKELAVYMERIKQGDFTVKFKTKSKDEIGKLVEGFNIMIEEIAGLIKNVKDMSGEVTTATESLAATSEETSASAEEVARTVNEIAKGASEQASESERGAALTLNLAKKFEELSQNTKEMILATNQVTDANLNGIKVMVNLQEKSKLNDEATDKIEGAILELDSKAKYIGSILETIGSIAEQTNLLALNASIEAARAGEHGRGFAVVAEEIRKLAENSRDAADEIKEIVINIQSDSNNTVNIMGEVRKRAVEQTSVVKDVHQSFDVVSKSIDSISGKIKEISSSVINLNKDKDLIVSSIENISAVSEETAASSEEVSASMEQQAMAIDEVAKAADGLNHLIMKLNNQINRFKI